MTAGETALAFLKKEATITDNGVGHVTQKNYQNFMAENGVTADMLKTITNVHQELVTGMYLFNNERLVEQVDEAKKAGRNPYTEKVVTSVNIPNGSIVLSTTAAKTYPIPRKPGETVTRTCVGVLDFRQDRMLDKDICAAAEKEMRAQLNL